MLPNQEAASVPSSNPDCSESLSWGKATPENPLLTPKERLKK